MSRIDARPVACRRRPLPERRRRVAALAALVTAMAALSACGGPSVPVDIAVESKPLDLTYGVQGDAPGGPLQERPSGTGLEGTTFPGFITPPVPLTTPPPPPSPTTAVVPPVLTVACPEPPRGARAAVAAGEDVATPPAEGVYRFRRTGSLRRSAASYADALESTPQALSPAVTRTVANVVERTTASGPEHQFDVVQDEEGMRTTTTYLVRPGDGVFLTRVVTQKAGLPSSPGSPADTESFLPRPMIRILNLPLQLEQGPGTTTNPDQSGAGVDPLTGVAMDVAFHNTGRTLVDGCGEVFEGWKISVDTGTFRRPRVRTFAFSGEFVIAPQLGGLVIADDITLSQGVNEYEGLYFHQQSRTILDDDEPSAPEAAS